MYGRKPCDGRARFARRIAKMLVSALTRNRHGTAVNVCAKNVGEAAHWFESVSTETDMSGAVRSLIIVFGLVLVHISPAFADEFPYERELLMDVKPLPGSKRVPILEVLPDGRAIIDLWCKSGD